jgi:hypothetical protein
MVVDRPRSARLEHYGFNPTQCGATKVLSAKRATASNSDTAKDRARTSALADRAPPNVTRGRLRDYGSLTRTAAGTTLHRVTAGAVAAVSIDAIRRH